MKSEKMIFLVDMQSFYASVEKAHNPLLKNKPIVVAGDPERRSGIILAACPLAKKYGIETAETLGVTKVKCPHITVVRPRMQEYIRVSLQISKILQEFTDLVEPYSIDEQFMDVTGSVKLFGHQYQMARKVQKRIFEKTGIYARVGIGPNKVLAKMACDHFAKKNGEGIARLDHSNIEKLWKLRIHKMFGVGHKMDRHLREMGITTIGTLAKYPLELLKSRWGMNGEILWRTANGIDYSPVTPKVYEQQKAIGHHMTLPRDYKHLGEIKVVLLELCTEVAYRSRTKGYMGYTVACSVRGADFNHPTGFHRQITLATPTNYDLDMYQTALQLLKTYWDRTPVRSIGITLSNLQTSNSYQLDLFDYYYKREQLNRAFDFIWRKYGRTSLYRASSLTQAGQAKERAAKIGGHYK